MLYRVRESRPNIQIGVFMGEPAPWMKWEFWMHRSAVALSYLQAQIVHIPARLVEARTVETMRDLGYLVHAADCNTDEQLDTAFALGADQLSTDAALRALSRRDLRSRSGKDC